jgi:ribonuclease HI
VPSRPPAREPEPLSGWIDGGARGNPGPAGIGVVLEDGKGGRDTFYGYLGSATNNVAEYAALLILLHHARQRDATELTVHSDSQLLVKQMRGEYRVKNPRLQRMHAAARRLVASIPQVTFRHVPREENQEADRLANQAMDERQSSQPLPGEVAVLLETGKQATLAFSEEP